MCPALLSGPIPEQIVWRGRLLAVIEVSWRFRERATVVTPFFV